MILYIKRNCLDDGPGIRTTVFFKGCPLSCAWCHNPESKKAAAELSYNEHQCIGCGACAETCGQSAIGPGVPFFVDRVKCSTCFECAAVCPSGALERLGGVIGMKEILEAIERDIPFFRTSGGGVTLSGGEPTLYMDFASKLLVECKKLGVSTLLETCAHFDFDKFRANMLENLDMIFADIKLISNEAHLQYCGISNGRILGNFRELGKIAAAGEKMVLPRIPLAPGITDTDENLSGIAEFLAECGFKRVALLPYNPTWLGKPGMVGAMAAYAADKWMRPEEIERCRSHFGAFDLSAR